MKIKVKAGNVPALTQRKKAKTLILKKKNRKEFP